MEVPDLTPLTQALELAGINQPTPAVLLGGFQGSWIPADQLTTPIGSKEAPAAAGIVYPLTHAECPIDTTAAIARYLADQSARQCGPCTNGLPALASAFDHLTSTTAPTTPTSQTRTAIDQLTHLLPGRGICKHPDATVRFITSTLTTFPQEITAHTHGTCTAHTHP
ncbi:NADH-ubiquinone oxidoreductase-F iron-sulfur binding region domain-containing protein [Rothia nasimurium]|uniref:NADH-ubiquinone oxidoreductase-F iron-sulfur binding region domain-containing protein n=1 Tax=Rothia nasimurium TaxID=85336 RepID=UPI0034DF18BF